MSIIENIRQRTSVRTYIGEPIHPELAEQIKRYIAGLQSPFGGKVRIELIQVDSGAEPVKLGTYGIISGAKDFLVLLYEDAPLAAQSAAYMFEQVVLFCTSLGLGTCWIGATFKKSDFATQARAQENEQLRIISPVGYPTEKRRLLERIMRRGAGSDSRKAFEALFFNGNFDQGLKAEDAGQYRQPLEMMRLSPSASNTQPYRAVLDKGNVHFYYRKLSQFSDLDLGIGLCHFGESCSKLGIDGEFEVLDSERLLQTKSENYVISWTQK